MRLALLGFSGNGNRVCRRLKEHFTEAGDDCRGYILEKYITEELLLEGYACVTDVPRWTGTQFQEMDALVFIGAAGIAVRMIAPYIKSKTTDPAVVVVDEMGSFAIPLLSGHIGGANDLALRIAEYIEALPVITTATDLHHKFAVDVYARMHGMWISDMILAKEISSEILAGKKVGYVCDLEQFNSCPDGTAPGFDHHRNIHVTAKDSQVRSGDTLTLVPPVTVLGIGCRKGCPGHIIEAQALSALKAADISIHSICGIATIDIKAEEPGILELAEQLHVPVFTYTAAELNELPGNYTQSQFVEQVTGVDNVCERAAMAACMHSGGRLVLKKTPGNGVTVAVAMKLRKANK